MDLLLDVRDAAEWGANKIEVDLDHLSEEGDDEWRSRAAAALTIHRICLKHVERRIDKLNYDAKKNDRAATDETLIAEAAAASTRAYNDAAALTEGVRKDGHDGIVGAASASAKALDIIGEHLASLKSDAEAALKAGNVASFLRFYDAAEGKRRERLLNDQGAALVGAFRADDVGVTSAPAPFILPAAHVRQ